jgi:hypothetical protein
MLLILIPLDAATEAVMRTGCHLIVNSLSRFRNGAELPAAEASLSWLIGVDTFSCDWSNRSVSVNYKAGGLSDGDLVSVEVR